MLAVVMLCLLQAPAAPTASTIALTGKESWPQVLALLQQTGNSVIDSRLRSTSPALKLPASTLRFWEVIDLICQQASLQARMLDGRVELVEVEGPRRQWIAYDGPWRAQIIRQNLIRFDNPLLDRLLLQVEVTIEPRYVPLLIQQKKATAKGLAESTSTGSISYDGEWSKGMEVRLPAPPRSMTMLEDFILETQAWVAPGLLRFNVPLQQKAEATSGETRFRLQKLESIAANRTLEIASELIYPAGSLDWESHQARLLDAMRLTLTKGKERLSTTERDIRTDTGRHTTARWLFRQAPTSLRDWQAELVAPASPVQVPLRFTFRAMELP
jgi:hypothetical protein